MHHKETSGEKKKINRRIGESEQYMKRLKNRDNTLRHTPGLIKRMGVLLCTGIIILCLISGIVSASGTGSLNQLSDSDSPVIGDDSLVVTNTGEEARETSSALPVTDTTTPQPVSENNQETSPIQPHEFYGTATVGGNPAPVGSTVVGSINGEERGSITTTVSGYYGSSDWLLPRLSIVAVDESEVGATIQFRINGEEADQTAIYTPGATTNLPLTKSSSTWTITATAGTGGSIAPAGEVSVIEGQDQDFLITADTCYTISDIIIDGSTHLGPQDSPYTYTFPDVSNDHSIAVVFSEATYTIMATAGTGGSISPAGETTVVCESDVTYTITPDSGYSPETLIIDGVMHDPARSYTFSDVTTDHTIHVTFTKGDTCTITPMTAMGGTISPQTPQTVQKGGSAAFTMTADSCYTITDVIIDSTTHLGSQTSPFVYTFSNVQASHTIQPVFSSKTSLITATAGTGGSISPPGETTVVCGSDVTYSITPDDGYYISELLIDSIPVTPVSSYTFYEVISDHTIHASFTKGSGFAITATATSGGTISPSGVTHVAAGGSQKYTITPDSGYSITSVEIDGKSIGGVTEYTFSNVQADHTIHAVFTSGDMYTIHPVTAIGGTITPATTQTVQKGGSIQFTITADDCYTISDILIDSTSLGPQTSPYTYTFDNVQASHTIEPIFSSKTYLITATAGTDGSISPAGETTVACGSDISYTITPDSGYDIADLTVDGKSAGPSSKYTFFSVTADHTIHATFEPSPVTHIIMATTQEGGIISPSGTVSVVDGGAKTFTISTDPCYTLSDVEVDGKSVGPVHSYTFSGVTTDHTIHVIVSRLNYTITASAGTGGTITPSGTISYWCGDTETFTITAGEGYYIRDVLVDGTSQGPVTTYTFTSIGSSHTIAAVFEVKVPGIHIISATAGVGGTISPFGAVTVADGEDQSFSVIPDTGYKINDLVVDGQSAGPVLHYSFMDVTTDHTIHAVFSMISPDLIADFSGMPQGGKPPLEVEFYDISTGDVTGWAWEFQSEKGEILTSSEKNPVIVFKEEGYWDVSLTVTDFYGRTDTKTISDYIFAGENNLPYAAFSLSPESGTVPLTVTFTDKSTGQINTWMWNFGDGSTSDKQDPVYTYENADDYIASLTVTNSYGSTTASRKITVGDVPHESSLSMPGGVFYRKNGEKNWQYYQISPASEKFNSWEYTTSYHPSPQFLKPPYVVTYENAPQSDFILSITDYNKELVLDDTYKFKYCVVDGNKQDNLSFVVPDQTDVIVQGAYYESDDDSFHLTFVNPIEGAMIPPGITDIMVQAEGAGLDPDHVLYIDPSGAHVFLAYNQQSGLFEGEFDATQYLDQTITLTALAERSGGYPDVRTEIQVTVNNQPVIPDFIATPLVGTAPLTVSFLDLSQNNPTSWEWRFGDDSRSDKQNPTHLYEKPGVYSVTLTVENAISKENVTRTDYITVNNPGFVADFDATPRSGLKPLTVTAYDLSYGDIVSWEWIFSPEDGTPITAFDEDPVVILEKEGNWDVMLTVTDTSGQTMSLTRENFIHVGGPQPVIEPPVFSAYPLSGTKPFDTAFTVTSPDSARQWYWNFGDEMISFEKEPNHTYEKPGFYSPQLTIWSDVNSATTVLPDYIQVSKSSDEPVALFSADPVRILASEKVWFKDESQGDIVSWAWDFGDGETSDKQNPVHQYTSEGLYKVSLTVTDDTGRYDTFIRDPYISVLSQGGGLSERVNLFADEGFITQGQVISKSFTVDSSMDSFTLELNWPGSMIQLALIYPDGTRVIIDPSTATGTTDSNVYYHAGSTVEGFAVQDPVPGTWTYEIIAYATSDEEPYYVTGTAVTFTRIEAALAADTISPGTPIEISARLLSGEAGTPVTEPVLLAMCQTPGSPDGIMYPVPLTLDETFTYRGSFADTTTPGQYTIYLDTDNSETQPHRIAILTCISEGYLIEAISGANGYIIPDTDVYVSAGDSQDFSIIPGPGYRVADLKVDDVSVGPLTSYRFNQVHTDHTIEAFFTPDTPEYDFVLDLAPGWNCVSIPKYPVVGQDTLGRLFGGIESEGHSIFMYNATAQVWDIPNETHVVTPLEAYFVYSKESVDLGIMFAQEQPAPMTVLMPAWNLMGYSGSEPLETRLYLAPLEDAWTFILGFDAEGQTYEETIIRGGSGPFSDARPMNPGEGYWVYCEQEILFIPS